MAGISWIKYANTLGRQDLKNPISINNLLFGGIYNPFNGINNNKE